MLQHISRAARGASTLRRLISTIFASVGVVALAACSSPPSPHTPLDAQPTAAHIAPAARSRPPHTEVVADTSEDEVVDAAAGGPGSADVVGHITWPDGVPAGGVTIEFYPTGYPYGGQSGGERIVTSADGSYNLSDCPCSDLGGLFVLPPSGGDWAHGGNQCLIMLVAANGQLTGSADPGDEVDWTMLDMPCSRDYILPKNIGQEVADIEADPQALSGGPWRNARSRIGR